MDHKVSKDMISSGMIPSGEKTQADLGRTQYGSAPSPNSLFDAYKSMYGNKEEVINEMAGKGMGAAPTPKPNAGGIAKPKPPLPTPVEKDSSLSSPAVKKEPPKMTPMKSQISDKDAKRERLKKIMADNESVDLLAAYRAVYEHHKKDADGNTIPHEDEEVNEGKIPAGLQAYLDKKKGKKEDKKEVKEEVDKFNIVYNHFISEGYSEKEAYSKMSNLTEEQLDEFVGAAMAGLKAVGGLMAKKGIGGALKTVGAKVGSKIGGSAGRKLGYKAGSAIANNPMTSYYMAKDLMPGGGGGGNQQPMMSKRTSTVSASADLFDIVKGQLIDEGLSEEEIKDIMLTLTPDEIMEELSDNIKRIDAQNKANFIKRAKDNTYQQKSQVPDKVREASKRQYKAGTPREDPKNPYTSDDRETIKNYYSKND